MRATRFNSRSRVGSDEVVMVAGPSAKVFQFTLPCRERPAPPSPAVGTSPFQFTLPCRERQAGGRILEVGATVSIHAPV